MGTLNANLIFTDPAAYLRDLATVLDDVRDELGTALERADRDTTKAVCRRLHSVGVLAYTAGEKL